MVCEELFWGNSSFPIHMLVKLIPAFGTSREQQGEVERHAIGIQITDNLQSTTSLLYHQVMALRICKDANLLQVCLSIVPS